MQSIKEQSLIDSAERVLRKKKTPLNLYQLFDVVCAEKEYGDKEKTKLITQFYTDLITSAKFVYTGDNTWDLKEFQKNDLREKDGSFYKEYTVIPDDGEAEIKEVKVKTKQKKRKKVKAKVKEVEIKEVKAKVKEVEIKEVKAKVKEEKIEEKIEGKIEEKVEEKIEGKKIPQKVAPEEKVTEYEEVFEEFEDEFDEDKYNEYMDTYEGKYDEK